MDKVLLVDDEYSIVEGVKKLTPWDELGLELVGTCLNAVEALDAVEEYKPDLIITDVRMPVMDGIELIRRVKKIAPDTQFIILSGYGEFELAKSAMKEGVKFFLLKPCSKDEICSAIKKLQLEKTQRDDKIEEELNRRLLEIQIPDGKEILEDRNNQKQVFEAVIEYVNEHYADENLNLHFVAKEILFMSDDYVGRKFQKQTGEYFTDYLNRIRIEKAKLLLRMTNESNESIAIRVGYGKNPRYFLKIFKKYTGKTPREYRRGNE